MSNKVHFLFPFEGPYTSIALRQPLFGDVNVVNLQTQVRHTRNGTVYAYKRTPTYRSLKLAFEKMRQNPLQGFSGREEILNFLALSAAKKILYIDHQGIKWSGLITNPTVEFTNDGKDNYGDLFAFTLEFEGQLV